MYHKPAVTLGLQVVEVKSESVVQLASHLDLDLVHQQLLGGLPQQRLLPLPPTPARNLRALLEARGGAVEHKHRPHTVEQQPGTRPRPSLIVGCPSRKKVAAVIGEEGILQPSATHRKYQTGFGILTTML